MDPLWKISAASSGKDIAITITPLDKSSDPAYHLALLMGLGEGYVDSQIESVDHGGAIKSLAGPEQGCQPGTKAQGNPVQQGGVDAVDFDQPAEPAVVRDRAPGPNSQNANGMANNSVRIPRANMFPARTNRSATCFGDNISCADWSSREMLIMKST